MRRRLFLLVFLAALILLAIAVFHSTKRPPDSLPRNELLHLVWTLHDHGLEFRAISGRPDGLWSESVYLTTTDKDFRELTRYPATAEFIDHWKGTVFISRNHHESNDCTRYGEWELFGDPELIQAIGKILMESIKEGRQLHWFGNGNQGPEFS